MCSQMWIASLVTSALQPGTATGLSRVAGTDVFLRDCLAENPAAWLGEAHAAHWGVSLGFLLKLLHSRDRLLLQTHPDGARARKYFGLPSGKDEAWYVLDTRPGACIWLGFRPGVTPAYFRGLIERQDTAALLDCLHQIPIRPGEVYFIPAGTAHAMGSDSLVAELQEPVDITLRAEYIRPDGSRLPVESMYGPA
ncbi:class I mannose-6-phosphate isomerase [Flavonifractor plautii]|nr:class I mannose-6-phosphate isomerase [Flavonifractor plautii]